MSVLSRISTATDERSARLAGIGLMLLSISMFSFGDALGKFLVSTYAVGQLLWLRACAALLLLAPFIWRNRAAFMQLERPWLQLVRVVLSTLEVAAFFLATVYLPLADVITYYLAGPIFVTALSALVLGEHVGWRRWSAIVAGLVGVLLILKPDASGFLDPWLLLPLLCCFMYAAYLIATRLVSRSDTPATSFFYTGVAGAAIATLIGPFYWTNLDGWDKAWMGVLCITGMSGHYLVIRAYELLDASAAQPITYLSLVYASLFGVLLYGESLTWNIIAGSVIVVGAGIFTVWREYVLRHQPAAQAV